MSNPFTAQEVKPQNQPSPLVPKGQPGKPELFVDISTGDGQKRRRPSRSIAPQAILQATNANKDEVTRIQNETAEIRKQLLLLEERYALEKESRMELEREMEAFRSMSMMSPRALSASPMARQHSSRLLTAIGQFSREQGRTHMRNDSTGSGGVEEAVKELEKKPVPPPLEQIRSPLAQEVSLSPVDERAFDNSKKLRDDLLAKEKQCAELEQQISSITAAANKERDLHKEREAQLLARIEGLNRQLETALSKRKHDSPGGGSTDDLTSASVAELQKTLKQTEKSEKECRALLKEERDFYSQQYSAMEVQLRMLTAVCSTRRRVDNIMSPSSAAPAAASDGDDSLPNSDSIQNCAQLGSGPASLIGSTDTSALDLKGALTEYQTFEDAFIHTLDLIEESFKKPIGTIKTDPITGMNLPKIFSNMDSLYECYQKLCSRAKKSCSKRNLTGLGRLFSDIYNSASLFDKYYQDFENSMMLVCDLRKGSAFTKLVTKSEAKQNCGGKTLEDFLLVPIEHFSQYTRLLLQICQALPARHPEMSALEEALVLFNQINQTWCDRLEDARNTLNVVKVSKNVANCPASLVQPKRRYLLESPANVVDEKNKSHKRYFYVFNDLLLECRAQKSPSGATVEPSRISQYKFVVQTSLNGASVQSLPDSGGQTNALRINFVNSSVTLCFTMPDMKYTWMSKLSKVLSTIPAPSAAALAALFAPVSPSSGSPGGLLVKTNAPRGAKGNNVASDRPTIQRRMSNTTVLPRLSDSPIQRGRQKRSETLGGAEVQTDVRGGHHKTKHCTSNSPPNSADSSPVPDDSDGTSSNSQHKHAHGHKHHGLTTVEKFSTDLHSVKGTATVGHGHHPRSPIY